MQFPSFSAMFLGSVLALVHVAPAAALSANQVRQIAEPVTVMIDGVNPGSGVLIHRSGDTYYVLTARHVVATPDGYTMVTAQGDRYPVDYSRVIPFSTVDLAIVPFTSQADYATANLASYAYDANFRNVYTAGWTANRLRQFSAGYLSDRNFSLAQTQGLRQDGYELFYSNLTEIGMSGGPVLDQEGRVIGIHGLAEGEEVNDGQRGLARVKRGFSSGIPISSFLRVLPQSRFNLSLRIDYTDPFPAPIQPSWSDQPLPLAAAASAADWTNRGNSLYRLGQLQAALNALNQAVQVDPSFYLAWYERGNVLFAMNRMVEALASYDRTIQLQPDLSGVWRDRGVLLARMNQSNAALDAFDRATALKPDDYVLWYMRGNLLNKDLRDYGGAIASYERSLAINANFADAWMGKGKALHELGRYESALLAYSESLRLNPTLSVALILQGKTLSQLGRRQEAIASVQRALQLQPNNSDALQFLSTLY